VCGHRVTKKSERSSETEKKNKTPDMLAKENSFTDFTVEHGLLHYKFK
jgi:hypothetical protein